MERSRFADRILTMAVIVLTLAAVFGYYRLVWGSLPAFVTAVDHYDTLFCDFVNHYYPMGQRVLSFPWPVEGFFYSAFFALLLRPLGAMELSSALWAWGAVQVVAAIALAVLPRRGCAPATPKAVLLYTLLFATSLPLLHNFKWGQVSVLVTLSVLASARLAQEKRDVPAGIVLALGTAIKYYAAFFLIYYAIRRRWRVLQSFAIGAVCFLLILPAMALGPMGAIRFQRESWLELSRASGVIAQDWNSQYFAHVVLRWLGVVDAPDTVRAVAVLGWAVVALMIWLVWALRSADGVVASDLSMAALLLSLPFVLSTSWPHYFVYLPFCQALAIGQLCQQPRSGRTRLFLALAILSVVLASVFAMNLSAHWNSYAWSGAILIADVLLMFPVVSLGRRLITPDAA